MIKSKQLENTLRSESNPFDIVYADRTVGDLNGAVRFTALNNTGSTIGAYKVVYINGVSGNTPTIALADADTASMPAFGLTASSSDSGGEVDVITFGNVKGVDTSLLTVGDVLYVSTTAGEYTTTPPTGSSAKLQNIGMVVKANSNGIIKVGGAGRSAATPNLDEGKVFIGNASNQSSQSSYQLPASLTNKGILVANSNGSAVTSTDLLSVDTANNTLDVDDNVKIRLGTGNDFEIFHDGTNSILKDNAASGGSTMKYLAGTQTFQNKDANKTMAVFNASGSIDLHYNGVKKFETTSSGVQTTGTLNLNGAYTLPTTDGTSGDVLTTNGSGTITFSTPSTEPSFTTLSADITEANFTSQNYRVPATNSTDYTISLLTTANYLNDALALDGEIFTIENVGTGIINLSVSVARLNSSGVIYYTHMRHSGDYDFGGVGDHTSTSPIVYQIKPFHRVQVHCTVTDNTSSVKRLTYNIIPIGGPLFPFVIEELTTATTGLKTNYFYVCDTTGGAFTVTLQDASDIGSGERIDIKNIGANTLTIDAYSSEKIDGSTTKTLAQYESVTLVRYNTTTTNTWLSL